MSRYLVPLVYLFLLFSVLMLYGKFRNGEFEGELSSWLFAPSQLQSYAIALAGSLLGVGLGAILDFLSKKGPFGSSE
ncbi:MAG: hypothetical protein AAGB04_30640 [Pseudomonadota bacterium]